MDVPDILLGGNHAKIAQWRLEKSKERTFSLRPDLYALYEKTQLVQWSDQKK